MRVRGATSSVAAAATLLLLGSQAVNAHTWVEELLRISAKGTLLTRDNKELNANGNFGLIRGFIENPADDNTWRLPRASDDVQQPPNGKSFSDADVMCNTHQETGTSKQILKAAAGDTIALRYLENGHVSKDTNHRPPHNGSIFIYMTYEPKPRKDEKLTAVLDVWTADGKGGDGRGKLLATRYYDDGRCYENNGSPISNARLAKDTADFGKAPTGIVGKQGANRWCQNDIKLPEDAEKGKTLTLYWVWNYSQMVAGSETEVQTLEYYTSCMEVDIVDDCDESLGATKGPKCAEGGVKTFEVDKAQNPLLAAVEEQLTMDNFQFEGGSGSGGTSGGSGSGGTSGGSGSGNSSGNDKPTPTTGSGSKPSSTGEVSEGRMTGQPAASGGSRSGGSGGSGSKSMSKSRSSERVKTVVATSGAATQVVTATASGPKPSKTGSSSGSGGRPDVEHIARRMSRRRGGPRWVQ